MFNRLKLDKLYMRYGFSKKLHESASTTGSMIEKLMKSEDPVSAAHNILRECYKDRFLFKYVVDFMKRDSTSFGLFRTELFKAILCACDTEFFLTFISELKLTETEKECLVRGVWGKNGVTSNIVSVLTAMNLDEFKRFLKLCSVDQELTGFMAGFLYDIVLAISKHPDFKAIFNEFITLFPELISDAVKIMLWNDVYSEEIREWGTNELYVLRFAADAKYIMNSYEYGKLYDFIRSSVKEILGNFFNFTCYTHEAIWILKNEFDVDFKRIYVALKREFEYMDCSAGADYFKSGTFDLNKRLADCALSAEGYEILSSRLMSALL